MSIIVFTDFQSKSSVGRKLRSGYRHEAGPVRFQKKRRHLWTPDRCRRIQFPRISSAPSDPYQRRPDNETNTADFTINDKYVCYANKRRAGITNMNFTYVYRMFNLCIVDDVVFQVTTASDESARPERKRHGFPHRCLIVRS